MTEDKGFKHFVRDEAQKTGRRYSEVRSKLRPPVEGRSAGGRLGVEEVAARLASIEEVAGGWVYDKGEILHLVALALIVPGSVLLKGTAGNGMTALGKGVAAAIGGQLVYVDGRSGFDAAEAEEWDWPDVVLVGNFDGMDHAAQAAVVEARSRPAVLLAKCHAVPDRMPYPPDDDTLERFLFGAHFGYVEAESELRIIDEIRSGADRPEAPTVAPIDLEAMRQTAREVEIPDEVSRFAVDAMGRLRRDPAVLLAGGTVATVGLVQASAASALADGRSRATTDDVRRMLRPVLGHRVVLRPGIDLAVDDLIDRVGGSINTTAGPG